MLDHTNVLRQKKYHLFIEHVSNEKCKCGMCAYMCTHICREKLTLNVYCYPPLLSFALSICSFIYSFVWWRSPWLYLEIQLTDFLYLNSQFISRICAVSVYRTLVLQVDHHADRTFKWVLGIWIVVLGLAWHVLYLSRYISHPRKLYFPFLIHM